MGEGSVEPCLELGGLALRNLLAPLFIVEPGLVLGLEEVPFLRIFNSGSLEYGLLMAVLIGQKYGPIGNQIPIGRIYLQPPCLLTKPVEVNLEEGADLHGLVRVVVARIGDAIIRIICVLLALPSIPLGNLLLLGVLLLINGNLRSGPMLGERAQGLVQHIDIN